MAPEKPSLPEVRRYAGSGGAKIYRIACDAFPGLVANIYLLLECGPPTLIDTGSGMGDANSQLWQGLQAIHSEFGESFVPADIQRIVITHGHIDHFGGVAFMHAQVPDAEIVIHELDVRILTAFEERVAVAKKAIRRFLQQAGVGADLLQGFMDIYGFSKKSAPNVPVARALIDGQQLDGLRFIHTPGHCPGQVCIALGDVLLSADHILPEISPHQAPESIMPYTGLGHYLESLEKIGRMGGFDLALGGHQGPIKDVYKRVNEIRQSHDRKLDKIFTIIADSPEPVTMNEISERLYAHARGFHILLAIEEVAAHVEYLYQHGKLTIANLDEFQREENPPVRYVVA